MIVEIVSVEGVLPEEIKTADLQSKTNSVGEITGIIPFGCWHNDWPSGNPTCTLNRMVRFKKPGQPTVVTFCGEVNVSYKLPGSSTISTARLQCSLSPHQG